MADIAKLAEEIANQRLTVLEASDLAKALEEAWGVSAAAAIVVAAPAAAGGDAAAAVEEETEFDVILTGDGGKKIQVIKEVRAITSLGLSEAKALVESAPKPVKEGVSRFQALKIKESLESQGATVELRDNSHDNPRENLSAYDDFKIIEDVVRLSIESLGDPVAHLSYIKSKLEGI